jgi:hypothetical protein
MNDDIHANLDSADQPKRIIPDREQPFPNALGRTMRVPEDVMNAGTPTNIPREDTAELMDDGTLTRHHSDRRRSSVYNDDL